MKTWLFLVMLLLGVSSFAQNQIVLTFTMPMPKDFEKNSLLLSGCEFGHTAIVNADTTKWTCPKNIRESVIYFYDKEMSEAQKNSRNICWASSIMRMLSVMKKEAFFISTPKVLYTRKII